MSTGTLVKGIVYGYYFQNLEPNKTYRIDFVYAGKSVLPQQDFQFNCSISPGEAVDNFYIRNDGDDPIRYSLNAENESIMQGGVITKGIERNWNTYDKLIKAVNFQLYSGTTTKVAIEVGI